MLLAHWTDGYIEEFRPATRVEGYSSRPIANFGRLETQN